MKGSALLLALGVLAFGAFWCQRATSPFLAIERTHELNTRVAAVAALEESEVMALRELLGADLDQAAVLDRSLHFVAERERLGHQDLAVLALVGHEELAERLLRDAENDPNRAAALLRPLPEAFSAVRFRAMVERFASRLQDRDS